MWTLVTIPWVQADLHREKEWWIHNHEQVGITYTDDITAPIPRTRLESVQRNIMSWNTEPRDPSLSNLPRGEPDQKPVEMESSRPTSASASAAPESKPSKGED